MSFGALQLLMAARAAPRITTDNMRRSRNERRLNDIPKGIKTSASAASAFPAPLSVRELLADLLAPGWLGAVV